MYVSQCSFTAWDHPGSLHPLGADRKGRSSRAHIPTLQVDLGGTVERAPSCEISLVIDKRLFTESDLHPIQKSVIRCLMCVKL